MSTDLQPFMFEGYSVRVVVGPDDEPWFVLTDVCGVLGLTTPSRVAERLDDDQKGVSLTHTLGGEQQVTIISQIGLIAVIMRSDKPFAKKFQRAALDYIKSVGNHGVAIAGVSSKNMARLLADPDDLQQTG